MKQMKQMKQKQPRVDLNLDPDLDEEELNDNWIRAAFVFWYGSQGFDLDEIAETLGWKLEVVKALDDVTAGVHVAIELENGKLGQWSLRRQRARRSRALI